MRISRLNRALEIRDAALPFLRNHGELTNRGIPEAPKHVLANAGRCQLSYRTPFQTGYESPGHLIALAAARGIRLAPVLPYGLIINGPHHSASVRSGFCVVMSIEWNDGEAPKLRKFLSGDWENELREFLAQSREAAA